MRPVDAVHKHDVYTPGGEVAVGSAQNVGRLVEVARRNAVGQVHDRSHGSGPKHFGIDSAAQTRRIGIAPSVVGGEGDDGHRCTFEAVNVMERIVHLEAVDPRVLYGEHNSLIRQLESYVPKLKIVARGEVVKFSGSPEDIAMFEEKLDLILRHIRKFNVLTSAQLERIVLDDSPSILKSLSEGDEVIVHGVNGHVIKARTANQQRMVNAVGTNDLTFALGPAGTGKTYTAVALAVRALKNKEVRRLVLTRPAVEAGERLGFLPGDLTQKVDPYLRPLYDALYEMLGFEIVARMIEKNVIEIAPLAYMRGRTFKRSFILADEMQNATPNQTKMLLTRLGEGSKMAVTGDLAQADRLKDNGLIDFTNRLLELNLTHIDIVNFGQGDIERHDAVKEVLQVYGDE